MPLEQGDVINERYRVAKILGRSQFRVVYRAWDVQANAPCALEELIDPSGAVQQAFVFQASRLLTLRHPNLATVLDAFSIPGQGHYLVLEFIEGEDLGARFEAQDGPLPESQVIPWAAQVCDALGYMHAQNPPIIHCDLKPSSLRVTADGNAILVGLGLSCVPGLGEAYGSNLVNAGFSAPEMYGKAVDVDPRTDVYGLGATLYQLLAGKRPSESALILSQDVSPLSPATDINPAISSNVSAAIAYAMRLNPRERYESAAAMKAGLLGGHSATTSPQLKPKATEKSKGRRWVWVVVGLVVALFILGAVVLGGLAARNYLVALNATPTASTTPTQTHTPQPSLTFTLPPPTATFTPEVSPTTSGLEAEIVDASGVAMILIPQGGFAMGNMLGAEDERPVHNVTLDDFYIDKYEITNARYAECVDAGVCQPPTNSGSATRESYYGNSEYDDFPVIYVSWFMAKAYCEWRGGRLPTEAEWEKAARDDDERTYPWGDQADCGQANFWGGTSNCAGDTVTVGSYPDTPSPYGVLDMAGNVWEWVLDWYDPGYYAISPNENPGGPSNGELRVMRGGSWNGGALQIRVTTRGRNLPDGSYNYAGLRCVRLP
jgi:formylglycine-generating enzyme required for sulfatase activity